jgi:hypothetical protein
MKVVTHITKSIDIKLDSCSTINISACKGSNSVHIKIDHANTLYLDTKIVSQLIKGLTIALDLAETEVHDD